MKNHLRFGFEALLHFVAGSMFIAAAITWAGALAWVITTLPFGVVWAAALFLLTFFLVAVGASWWMDHDRNKRMSR